MSANQILPGLWLGDLKNGKDRNFHRKNNITCDVHAMMTKDCNNDENDFLHIPISDHHSVNIFKYFSQTVKFIHRARKKKRKVLVHCRAGISRSSTLVAAYLIWLKRWDHNQAINFISRHRPIVNPNDGFYSQLKDWSNYLTKYNKFKKYKLATK